MERKNEDAAHRGAPLASELEKALKDTHKSMGHLHAVGGALKRESEALLKEVVKRSSGD